MSFMTTSETGSGVDLCLHSAQVDTCMESTGLQ